MSTELDGPARTCPTCGLIVPLFDLEAEAREVDRALGFEFGRIVDRWEWAARQPDGIVDNILGWLPAVRRRRAIWRRGQELWEERIRSDGIARCPSCQAPLPSG